MSEGVALFRAVCEHPEDDGVRLVYADWLTEHGDEARAQLMRAQVRLALLDEDEPERDSQEEQVDALLRENQLRWQAELPQLAGIDWSPATFRRGFVDEVRATSVKALAREAQQVRRAVPLRRLRLVVGRRFRSFGQAACLAGVRE